MSQFNFPTVNASPNVVQTIPRPTVPGKYDQLATILGQTFQVAGAMVKRQTQAIAVKTEQAKLEAQQATQAARLEEAAARAITAEQRVEQVTLQMKNEEAAAKTKELARDERLGLVELYTKDRPMFNALVKSKYRYLDPQNQDFVESAQGTQLAIDDWTPLLRDIMEKLEGNPDPRAMETMVTELMAAKILERQDQLTPIAQMAYEKMLQATTKNHLHGQMTSAANHQEMLHRKANENSLMGAAEQYMRPGSAIGIDAFGEHLEIKIAAVEGEDAPPIVYDNALSEALEHGALQALGKNADTAELRRKLEDGIALARDPDRVRTMLAGTFAELDFRDGKITAELWGLELKDIKGDMNAAIKTLQYTDLIQLESRLDRLGEQQVMGPKAAALDIELENAEADLAAAKSEMEARFPIETRMRRNGVDVSVQEMANLKRWLGERPDLESAAGVLRRIPAHMRRDAFNLIDGTEWEDLGRTLIRLPEGQVQEFIDIYGDEAVRKRWPGITAGQGKTIEDGAPGLTGRTPTRAVRDRWSDLYLMEAGRAAQSGQPVGTTQESFGDDPNAPAITDEMIRLSAMTGAEAKLKAETTTFMGTRMLKSWVGSGYQNDGAIREQVRQDYKSFSEWNDRNGFAAAPTLAFQYRGKTYIPAQGDDEYGGFLEIDPNTGKTQHFADDKSKDFGILSRAAQNHGTPEQVIRNGDLRYREEDHHSRYVDQIDDVLFKDDKSVGLRSQIIDRHRVDWEAKTGVNLSFFDRTVQDMEPQELQEFTETWNRYRADLDTFVRGLGYAGFFEQKKAG